MKKILIISLFLLLILTNTVNFVYAAALSGEATNPKYLTEILDENGNVPAYEYYPNHLGSRGIKVLKEYDGKIFMGLGDWDDNTGPVKMVYYDTKDEKIKSSGTLPDEAVQIFNIIGDKLYTTGCDPRDGWGYGSYYIYNKNENTWEQHRKQNGWIHVFNIVEFNNKLFMCGSVNSEEFSPIQYSANNGETFENVTIYKDGSVLPHNTSMRGYELVSYNNNLYGYIKSSELPAYDGIYLYDEANNRFDYISNLPSRVSTPYSLNTLTFYNMIYFHHEIFNNEFLYISGNYLYKSNDLKNFTKISHGTQDAIQDVVVNGDTLYTLSYAYNSSDKSFKTRIYSTQNLKDFNLVYEFTTDTPPYSIEYYDGNFYVGTALGENKNIVCKDSNKNGSLYKIKMPPITNNTDNLGNNNNSVNNNNNNKLPQTGHFFEIKNLVQIILLVSILSLGILLTKKPKSKK